MAANRGWREITLGEITAEISAGVSVNSESRTCSPGEVGVLKTSAVTYGTFRPNEHKTVLPDEVARARLSPRKGAILVSRMNTVDLVGASVYVPADFPCLVLPDRIWQFIPTAAVEPIWLHQYLSMPASRAAISGLASGTSGSMKNISKEKFLTLEVPLPPLAEQRAIAAILSSIDDLIEKTEAVIAQLQVVKKAVMQELLTRGLPRQHTRFKMTEVGEVPETWAVSPLHMVASVQTGIAKGKPVTSGDTVDVPYLRVANVQDGFVDLSEMKTLTVEPAALDRYALRAGDVLFTEGGDADKLGRGCAWRGQITPCLHQNHVFAVRPDGQRLLPDLLAYYAGSPRGKAYFLDCAKQTTNLASINSSQLKAMPVPVPPLDEQEQIVAAVAAIEGRLEMEWASYEAVRQLKAALAAALLTGELRVNLDQEVAA